jgi:DNA-directed RNA polymerase subunit RPC12/RpoP
MILRDDGLICPYCGSVETEQRRDRDELNVYGCDTCDRTFSAPRR